MPSVFVHVQLLPETGVTTGKGRSRVCGQVHLCFS